ncbi:MAG TPA: FimV/HubP family polar landmark protein [Burkholderiales bacterium]|nr:FimV/HubP family polar landmark protein [Burkholderiales bacterium]
MAGLLLMPLGVLAAGLGKLTVLSGLGQPLHAEVDVVAIQRGEAETLAARIATPEAFREAGVEYGAVVPQVRAALERRPDNRHVISLTTQQPVEEPFIDLLVELNWAAGRLVRQYTFLLDPAEYKGPQAITVPPKVAAPEVKPVEQPKPPVVTAEAPPAPAATPPQPASPPPQPAMVREPPGAPGTYEVKQGDTLGKIALEHRIEGVTPHQMLVALYRANEDAFINKNMNLVRAGRVLTIPDKAAAEAVAAPDASKIVVAQWQGFNEYRAKLGQRVAAAPARDEPAQQRAAGRITEQPEAAPAAPKAAAKDELRISKADAAKSAKAAAQARADDIAARERALKEANERVAALEKNVQDMQKLLELKNQQFADLQKQAQAAKAAPTPEPAPAPVAKAEPPKPEAPKAAEPARPEPPKPEAPKPEAVAAAPVTTPPPEAPKAAPPAPTPEAPEAAAPKKPAPPPPAPEPSFVDMILEEPLYLAGGGGGILALLIGGYLWRRKRSAKLENSLLGVTTTDSSSVFGTTGGRSVDTGGSSLQTDFSQSGIGAIDTDEVDPVAEADVYMAYGRDTQAEEILKEALQKDPNRQAVRVKLLEIYATRKDLKAFETTAGELYAASGGQGPDWAKAVELGQQVDPTNPMYGGRPGASPERSQPTVVIPAAVAATAPDLALDLAGKVPPAIDFDLDAGTKGATAAAPDLALDVASQAPADFGFDLNLGGDSQKPPEEASDFSPSGTFIMDAATKKAVSDMVESQGDVGSLSIDFELPGTAKPAAGSPASFGETAKMMAQSQPTNVVDFDFKPEAPKAPGSSQGMDLSAISFDLGKPAGGEGAPVNAGWQEVATKLDLAKAYQEMGDKDGARELLNEVLKEGDAAQQQQAKTMLAALR